MFSFGYQIYKSAFMVSKLLILPSPEEEAITYETTGHLLLTIGISSHLKELLLKEDPNNKYDN